LLPNSVSGSTEDDEGNQHGVRTRTQKKNECKAAGAPSTEVLTKENQVRRDEAGQEIIELIGGANLASLRFCQVSSLSPPS
jgi:hypothetical protein